ncbi:MAG: lamin tail domain-containing protein [Thermoflexales bacterium]|nr:lamin tail domain-containing protein [Thermoflexales bacterium]
MNADCVSRIGMALVACPSLGVGLWCAWQVAHAADTDVVLSEVMFNPACNAMPGEPCGSGIEEDESRFEWVEIYNKGGGSVDLSGWRICDELPANCDPLTGTLPPGAYWLVAHNNDAPYYDLQSEFDNYGASVDNAKTLFLNDPIGSNGLADGDAVYLTTANSFCGPSGDLPCVVDCVSWDSYNSCAALVDEVTLAYWPGAGGYDDTNLTYRERDGQSIVNVNGKWYQGGPGTDQANQASPYAENIAEGGTPTAIALFFLGCDARLAGLSLLLTLGMAGAIAAFQLLRWQRRK